MHNNELDSLFHYQGTDAHSGVTFLPKRGVNVRAKELTRAFRIIGGSSIEPVPFTLPRTQDAFIPEAYPPTVGLTPYTTAQEWIADPSVAGIPVKFSLEGMWDGSGLTTVAKGESASTSELKSSSPKASVSQKAELAAPTPVSQPEPSAPKTRAAELETKPVLARFMSDAKAASNSMAAAASKFADSDQVSDKDDDSNFSELPASRPAKSDSSPRSSTPSVSQTRPAVATQEPRSNAEIENLVQLAEKCKSDIAAAQTTLASLTSELKSVVTSLDLDNSLKERIKKLTV